MKLKKLVSLVLSLAIASSYAVNVSASWSDTAQSGGRAAAEIPVAQLRYRYYGMDDFTSLGAHSRNDYFQTQSPTKQFFSNYLSEQLPDFGRASNELPTATLGYSGVTDFVETDLYGQKTKYRYLPTKISANDMNRINSALRTLSYSYSDPTVSLPIVDPSVGKTYTAFLTKSGANGIAGSLGGNSINLALRFSFDPRIIDGTQQKTLQISMVSPPQGMKGSVEYKISHTDFISLLNSAGLSNQALSMYSKDGKTILKPLVTWGNDAVFTLDSDNGWGVCYTIWDETEYITKSEAQKKVDDAIGELKRTDIAALEKQIADLKNQIKQLDDKYVTESEVDNLINSYFKKETNLNALVEAILKHEKFDDLIEEKLKDYFGFDSSDLGSYKNILIAYIIGQVTTELKNLDTRLDKLESLIVEAIKSQLGNIFKPSTTLESLKDFILGLQLLGSLKGEDGKDGKDGADGKDGKDGLNGLNGRDGIDGEDFAEWATRNYGGIGNFINQISFEGWARSNYGSVDNFIRSISGTNGFSAYELAVQNGYYGSLGQWLESLRGKDGKSAYELAVENGYNGTERQWLDSLQGEDGADGEDGKDGEDGRDGRDGRDGSIVYVNGTYGELPSSDNVTGTTQYPSNGSANNDVTLTIDPPASSGSKKGAAANPATGAAVGIFLPAAAAVSVLLVKKGGRKRGRK